MAEHVLQEGLPPIEADAPSMPLEEEAKEENIRLASLWQCGQGPISFD
ncbi:MAG TPA: hypothetical protein VMY79_03165 [Dehalococcoidia bacterium]|nr:hypothetical protein [Dehalococcoidia bacterium]